MHTYTVTHDFNRRAHARAHTHTHTVTHWSNLRKQSRHQVKKLLFRIGLEHPSLRKHGGNAFLNLALCGLLYAMIMLLSDMPNLLVFSMGSVKPDPTVK